MSTPKYIIYQLSGPWEKWVILKNIVFKYIFISGSKSVSNEKSNDMDLVPNH